MIANQIIKKIKKKSRRASQEEHKAEQRKEIKDTADGSYSEFIYFELSNQDEHFVLKDLDLQKVNLLYGRICFCKGSSGYFRISSGTLFVDKHSNTLDIDLSFKSPKGIPQIITQIKETISY